MLSSYLFKTNFKIDEKFNAKGIQNNGIWNHTAKGYWENKNPFLTCSILCFDFHLQNSNIFVKTVCTIRKYSKIPPELFQIKFSYLKLIKIFAIMQNYFSGRQILQIILYISKGIKDYVIIQKALEIYLSFSK